MKKAIFPGAFDPITQGHLDVIHRGLKLFDTLIIAVAEGHEKRPLFSLEERIVLIKQLFRNNQKVRVLPMHGLLVDFAKQHRVKSILRGLRTSHDFDYEMQMANMNRAMDVALETVFLSAQEHHVYISSSLVRTIAMHQGDLTPFIPKPVIQAIMKKIQTNKQRQNLTL